MSACSHTLRALSRSRKPTNKTLAPFLYQTATIQQWRPVAQPITRRGISRYTRRDDTAPTEDIPFEDKDNLPPALDDLEPARKTTITGSERAAFEKLYRKFNTRGSRSNEKDHKVEIDAIADEYWEPEDEDNTAELDKIFDSALKGNQRAARPWNRSSVEQMGSRKAKEDLQSMAIHVLNKTLPADMKRAEIRASRKKQISEKAAKLNEARMKQRNRVDELLKSAKTDRELWDILHREVFDLVRQLDLDSTHEPAPKNARPPKSATPPINPKILFTNYPHHVLTALTTLRKHFPASPLPLSILPTIKSLGRSSYALGATTALYTQLLHTAWVQQSSYPLLASLLSDMHNNAIEFSADTLALLDQVLREYDTARSGRLGRELQMVYGMEQFGEGIREVRRWRSIVASRVGVDVGREKGAVPAPRRRRTDDLAAGHNYVPLVEGSNDVARHRPRAQPAVEHADAQVEFGFLGDDATADVPETSASGIAPTEFQTAESEVAGFERVQQKLDDEARDDAREEQGKTAADAEAVAKTSSGEPVPWTPS